MSLNLNGLMVSSENPTKLVDFYTKVFGEPTWKMDPMTGWVVGSGNIMVAPHSEVHGQAKDPARIIFFFETTDVKGEFDRIKGLGAGVVSEPEHPGGAPENATDAMLACLSDPDGNYFQLITPMPEM